MCVLMESLPPSPWQNEAARQILTSPPGSPPPLVDQLTDELHFYQLCKVNRSFNLNANGVPLPKLYRMSHHFSTRHRVPVTAVDLTPSDKWRGSAVSF